MACNCTGNCRRYGSCHGPISYPWPVYAPLPSYGPFSESCQPFSAQAEIAKLNERIAALERLLQQQPSREDSGK